MKKTEINNLFALLLILSAPVYGQVADDAILDKDLASSSYKGDPINIEGYKKEYQVSDRELESIKQELVRQKNTIQLDKEKGKSLKDLSRTTEKLTDVREEMIEEKIDSQKAIAEHNKKFKESEDRLKCLEANGWDRAKCPKNGISGSEDSDSLSLRQSSVDKEKLSTELAKDDFQEQPTMKITPFTGMSVFQGEYQGKVDSFESKLAVGLKAESKVHEKIGVGVGFTYTRMSIFQTPNLYNSYFGTYNYGFSNSNYLGREIEYNNFAGDIFSKFYFVTESRFRPYAGIGLGFSRTKLNFKETSQQSGYYNYSTQGMETKNDGYISNALIGELMAGVDIVFTRILGMNFELKYIKGIAATSTEDSQGYNMYSYGSNYSQVHDQYFLDELGGEIDASNNLSVSAGVNVSF